MLDREPHSAVADERIHDPSADDAAHIFARALRVYEMAMNGECPPESAFDDLSVAEEALLELGAQRAAESVRDCAAKLYDDKIPGGLDGLAAAALHDNQLRRMRCRVVITRGRRRARSSHRRVGARTAAKATSTGDPDAEPPAASRRHPSSEVAPC